MTKLPWNRRLAAVASLGDENRRRLFDFVASAADAVGRDDAAQAVGLARSTASFHLDRLVNDGLLAVEFRKLGGREGPGSGRPSCTGPPWTRSRPPSPTATMTSPPSCWSPRSSPQLPAAARRGMPCSGP